MTATLSAMPPTSPAPRRRGRTSGVGYAEASRSLLREMVLDAMHDLLLTKDWSAVTLSDVAGAAGVSRQSIYNEFGSRQGLAQGYALRLGDRVVDAITAAIEVNDAGVLARAVVRLAMSDVSMPPEADHDVADDLARLLAPFVMNPAG